MSDVRFNIYSGLLKAYKSEDGIRRLKTTASSTIRDLAGDTISLKALQKMAATAEQNMTIFLNHKYQVPEDVLGSVEKTNVRPTGDTEVWDLDFDVRVEESNPRAVKTWEAIDNGTKLGTSIGAKIPEGGATREKDGLMIDDVILLEASIVGIPANPRSFVHYAVKAFESAEDGEDDEATTVIDTEKAKVWVTVDTQDTADADSGATSSPAPKGKGTKAKTKEEDPEVTKDTESPEVPEDTPVAGDGDTTETDETAGPSEEEDEDGEDEAAEDEQPDNTDVPATQEAQKSGPESEGTGDETAPELEARLLGASVEVIRQAYIGVSEDLAETRSSLATETEKRVAAERELDEAKEDLKLAQQIVERLAALPIGQRASGASKVTEFRTKFASLYDSDFLNILEK